MTNNENNINTDSVVIKVQEGISTAKISVRQEIIKIPATANEIGMVKPGKNLSVENDGTLNADTYSEAQINNLLSAKADISSIPTNVSELNNDSNYVTQSYLENELENLPAFTPATTTTLGGVIVGDNINVDANGRISASANITVDSALSTTSENPVQNKVITGALDEKQSTISDLATIRSGAALGATALQSGNNISELTNDSGFITSSSLPTKTSDLTNDSGYITSSALNGYATESFVTSQGYITGITSSDVTTALGYTPYNSTNPSGYITSSALSPYALTADLAAVATSGSYNDLNNKPTIPTVNDATLTIQKNGTSVGTFTANSSTNSTVNITVPTVTSDLTNDSGFITSSSLPTKTSDLTNDSGYITSSAVGDGTITFTQGGVTKGSITTNQSGNATIALDAGGGTVDQTYSSTSTNAQSGVAVASAISGKANTADLANVATSGSYADLSNTPTIPTVNNATLTITQGGTTKGTFTANASSDVTIALDSGGSSSGASRNIGEIVASTIPLSDAGLHLLNGGLLSGSGSYADFVDYIADLYNSDTYTIYAYVYNDGTDDYTIYADSATTPTELYNYDGSSYTGSDFTVSSGVVYYSSNTCTYTSADNVEVTNLAYFTDETSWQAAVTSYGVCGKFVYDSLNDTVRLPRITGIVEGTTSVSALGDLIEAGLPNITGETNYTYTYKPGGAGSGAFSYDTSGGGVNISNYSSQTGSGLGTFDASLSNSIYGNSSTVQPQTIKVLYYIVVANSTKTSIEVDIDEIATDLNGKLDTADLSEVQCVVETYSSGASWYRVWSDGFCEQGGYVSASTYGSTTNTVTLLKPYKNTYYTVVGSKGGADAGSVGINIPVSKTTSSFTWSIAYTSALIRLCDWVAYGYIR